MGVEEWVPTVGLEVHVQLKTDSKMFCSCSTRFGATPNAQCCPVCLGLPGVLPVINEQAVRLGLKVALALGCEVLEESRFYRKNYWYPDLPKNYQISQYDEPLARNGHLSLGQNGAIRIRRVHLEEDAGKLVHPSHIADRSWVDYNRSGMPLLEIVSEPDLHAPEDAYLFLLTLKSVLLYLGVSDCNMEEGSLRCDANVSVSLRGQEGQGIPAEIKNLNSFKAVQKALEYDARRQSREAQQGKVQIRETRLWDEKTQSTRPMRSKEEAHDYRYFIEPDLSPVVIDPSWIEETKRDLPELPLLRRERLKREYGLPEHDADVLTQDKGLADYYEKACKASSHHKDISNWMMGPLLAQLNERSMAASSCPVSPWDLVELIDLVKQGTVSQNVGKDILGEMFASGKKAQDVVKERGLAQISSGDTLTFAVKEVIVQNPKAAEDYKAGKQQAFGFLMGQVMKATQGKANPQVVREILEKTLKS